MARLKDKYRAEVVSAMQQKFGYKNINEVPRLEKIVINMGLGDCKDNAKAMDVAVAELATIAGQKPLVTKAKKSVANFKLRAGMNVGAKVTLRGSRMYEFADKLVSIVLPRVRDFRGVSNKAFDGRGNFALGVREQLIFPEIEKNIIFTKLPKMQPIMKLTPTLMSLLCICLLPAVRVSAQESKATSFLRVYDTITREISTVKEYPFLIEAPNWTQDGKYLIYNSGGSIWRIAADGTANEEKIDMGFADRCNNDHVLSPDGKRIAVSHSPEDDWKSRIYILPLEGGAPRLVTPEGPSYLHGWSPDGKWLSYCAERDGEYDVYVIEAVGGKEIRLTDAPGLDDGPEYSPCGRYIWFNSVRTGSMQVWRMKADGTGQTQMTADEERNSWFPHVSPDGKTVVFISYRKGDVEPGDHPPGKQVELRLMPTEGGEPETVVELLGGQGSFNVNSWAPDSRRFAFVSYRYE